MLITVVLIAHLILAASVLAGFTFRYILAFKNKSYPSKGRLGLLLGSIGLVISGVGLSVIGKLPIGVMCLDSLGLVIALLVMEFGLQKLADRLSLRSRNII